MWKNNYYDEFCDALFDSFSITIPVIDEHPVAKFSYWMVGLVYFYEKTKSFVSHEHPVGLKYQLYFNFNGKINIGFVFNWVNMISISSNVKTFFFNFLIKNMPHC